MTYRNNDRGGARRDDRNHRPFNGRNQRRGSQHGGRRGGNPKADVGGFRGTPLEINEDTPFATEFAELGIPSKLAYGLGAQGILEPFPIQAATIGDALAGRDVLGRGRTGSGKTLAFGLPLLSRLMGNKSESTKPRGMILVPTRELAMQVHDALAPLGHLVGLKFSIIIGGAQYSRQIDSLARGADIVVATPGRLEDLIERGACDLSAVEIAILDEADQMADMGFLPIVSDLMALIPAGGQRLLFSATLDRGVDAIVEAHLVDPVEHATDPGTASVTTMDHHVFLTEPRDKFAVVRTIATRKGRCIAFVRTQRAADEVSDELRAIGVQSDALHGGKTQAARNKALSRLKAGEISVLIATDVAARGIHIDDIDLVLNIDLPRDHKDYLHRAGRTARAGANGLVISIGSVKQKRTVKRLMDDAGLEPTYHTVRASDDVVAELAGATDVVTHRPRTDGSEPRRERSDRDDRRERPAREERRDDRPRFDRERPAREERRDDRPRFDRDRPARDERRDDRPRFDRDDRRDAPRRDDRRDDRPRFDRDRPREDRPRFDRDDRRPAARTEFRDRPARDDRRDDRPRFDRDDRRGAPRRDDRRDDRPQRKHYTDDRPFAARERSRSFDDRRDDRPRFDRDDRRPARDDRRDDRPRFDRDDRRERPARDDRRDDRPRERRSNDAAPAAGGNRKARRAHLQRQVTKAANSRRGTSATTAPAKKGRSGKPRPKNKVR